MNALLVFEAKHLRLHYRQLRDLPTLRLGVNIFLHYCLGLLHHQTPHSTHQLQQFVKRCYINQHNTTTHGNIVDLQTGQIYDDSIAETLLELIDILEQYYLYEVMGSLNDLNSEYGITQLEFFRLSPINLLVLAKCVHMLPAPAAPYIEVSPCVAP